ncbi:hypothetical protein [Chryseotalea sanaruensis]|nr:hypothetical protein [Chryseotalea sanaruensis]
MKKTFSIFVMLTIVSSVVLAGGIDNPKASSKIAIMQKDADHIQLFYKNTKVTTIEVSIYDTENKLLFTEVIRKSDGFIRPYDLSAMKKGEYTVVVNDGTEEFVEKINTSNRKVLLLSNVISMKKKDSFLLTVADEKAKRFTVRITDQNDRVLYEQEESLNKQYSKIYNFANNTEGLKFLVTTDQGASTLISAK